MAYAPVGAKDNGDDDDDWPTNWSNMLHYTDPDNTPADPVLTMKQVELWQSNYVVSD